MTWKLSFSLRKSIESEIGRETGNVTVSTGDKWFAIIREIKSPSCLNSLDKRRFILYFVAVTPRDRETVPRLRFGTNEFRSRVWYTIFGGMK